MDGRKYEKQIMEETEKIFDVNDGVKTTNEILSKANIKYEVSAKTIENVIAWALNGQSDGKIAKNLELTPQEFKILCNACPSLMYAMQKGKQLAEMVLVGSAFETAIGGKIVKKQQIVRVHEYNDCGKVIGEHNEVVWVQEELPPNALLLKFLLESKLDQNFGKNKTADDVANKQMANIISNYSKEDIELAENIINGK